MEPGFCEPPVTFDCCGSDAQNVCCFFNGKAAEVAQLDHPRFLCIKRCQSFERIVQRNQFRASFDGSINVFIQREFLKILTALFRIVLACMIHKQASHNLGSNSEKMSAVLPVYSRLVYEPHISLMHQRGGLQRVIHSFTPQIIRRQLPQFIVDDG